MNINEYFNKINQRFQSGISTEHSYRGDLQSLLEALCSNTDVTNEPIRIACGAPDYILTKKGETYLPVGYVEAKDVLENMKLDAIENSEQILRYRGSLNNFILTNYIEFRFFLDGEKVTQISIAKTEGKKLIPLAENWPSFENLIKDFAQFEGVTIRSALKLAEIMASKARLMQQVIKVALESDEQSNANSSLKDQMKAFKNILLHDIEPSEFADIYAQTIAYGMFAARLHDLTLGTFSRQEAAELIPKSNPFLKKLFGYIAGIEIDERIIWIIDALAEVFRATDVASILKNFGKATKMEDPMIHFYETFLAEYNPKLRKSRGVWYTPEPVVNFIVRAVDDILKSEFNLPMGLADNSKIRIIKKQITKATADKRSKIKEIDVEQDVHKVQILDPAVGTGTFLAEVIRQIFSKFQGQLGVWSQYAEDDLIPRIYGFEILMASYAMAHLKLDLLLKQTGYVPTKKENRLRVYLTNSLEEVHPDSETLFASWLSQEATEANSVKRDAPVMVVIGNPPYSVSSSNRDKWIQSLIADYKKNLNEKKLNLDDDYIKFIRYAQYFIEKNGQGVIAMITNNSFIDAVTCRQMRESLYTTFDKIYIYDLHGSTKKNESAPDGTKDENVFDIQQGVSISVFVKRKEATKEEPNKVFHFDSYGSRINKYKLLNEGTIESIKWNRISIKEPYYFFVPKDFNAASNYNNGFSLNEIFPLYNSGISTDRDSLFVDFDEHVLAKRIQELLSNNHTPEFIEKYRVFDSGSYKISKKKKDKLFNKFFIQNFLYRPFDIRKIYYDPSMISRPAYEVMRNLVDKDNLSLITCRQQSSFNFQHIFISKEISEGNSISLQTKERSYVYPLYIYKNGSSLQFGNESGIHPNINKTIVDKIAFNVGAVFSTPETPFENGVDKVITPVDLFDYVYAVLHHPTYRLKYKEFFKIDFPRIPFPKDLKIFRKLIYFGYRLRKAHLLEDNDLNVTNFPYSINGNNEVSKIYFENSLDVNAVGKVFINELQYFDGVTKKTWEFYIGGFQPAQKWLKERKGLVLTYEDIKNYQRMLSAIEMTIQLMEEIDTIKIE